MEAFFVWVIISTEDARFYTRSKAVTQRWRGGVRRGPEFATRFGGGRRVLMQRAVNRRRRRFGRARAVFLPLLALLIMAAEPAPDPESGCPERPSCRGCGCKGGPGYRGPDGHCVGFRALDRVCGIPPTERCTFENAPGTGANAECAMRSHHPRPIRADHDEEEAK
jgi:hypothetical protein